MSRKCPLMEREISGRLWNLSMKMEVFPRIFVYESSVRFEGREARDAEDALPASMMKNQVEHLCDVKDNNSALKLELHYYIYEDCDVI